MGKRKKYPGRMHFVHCGKIFARRESKSKEWVVKGEETEDPKSKGCLKTKQGNFQKRWAPPRKKL